jgi:hypothetical protein
MTGGRALAGQEVLERDPCGIGLFRVAPAPCPLVPLFGAPCQTVSAVVPDCPDLRVQAVPDRADRPRHQAAVVCRHAVPGALWRLCPGALCRAMPG